MIRRARRTWNRLRDWWKRTRCEHDWYLPEEPANRPDSVRIMYPRAAEVRLDVLPQPLDGEPLYSLGLGALPDDPGFERFGVTGSNIISNIEPASDALHGMLVSLAWGACFFKGEGYRPVICRRCHWVLHAEDGA